MGYEVKQMYLTPNRWSRPQTRLNDEKGVVIHWVANPGSGAEGNRSFFESRKSGTKGFGSAHEIIKKGLVVLAVPPWEMCYHVGSKTYTAKAIKTLGTYPNNCTYGIEFCHPDWDGRPDDETYLTLVARTAYHLNRMGRGVESLWTHHGVVGWKDCPRYYVNNSAEWKRFVEDVNKSLKGGPVKIDPSPVSKDDLEYVELLDEGDRGPAVKTLQEKLNKLGFNIGTADGIFGEKTEAGVRAFQKSAGIRVDGIAGKDTIASLDKAIESKNVKPKAPTVSGDYWIIEAGDTLWEIARDSKTTVEKLLQLNKGIEAKELKIGDKVLLRAPSKPAPDKPKAPSFRTLRMGMSGSDVRDLQNKLNSKGFNAGKVDGIFGGQTQTAIKQFQNRVRIAVDGIYGSNTKAKLDAHNPPSYPGKLVRKGERGEHVKHVQRFLGVKDDGIFGIDTENAVKNWQRRNRLVADGIVGPATWNKMF